MTDCQIMTGWYRVGPTPITVDRWHAESARMQSFRLRLYAAHAYTGKQMRSTQHTAQLTEKSRHYSLQNVYPQCMVIIATAATANLPVVN